NFFIEAMPELNRAFPAKGAWEFVYRVRPKSTDVKEIPSLKLVIYDPRRKTFPPKFADEIPIKVTPTQVEREQRLNVVDAPEDFFRLRENNGFWRVAATRLVETLVFWGVPLACGVALLAWRLRHADGAAGRARRRSRAAQRALLALRQ